MTHYKNWEVTTDAAKIAWIGINTKDSSTNVINNEVLDELNSILHDISQSESLNGIVIHSLKENGFIAGADVNEFATFTQSAQFSDFLQKGQTVFAKLESLKVPKVAMIDGFCMGGGLELALACDYRIGTNSKNTKIGLPEILLGIHPGWGGTVRLPKLIGGFNALSKVILTGAASNAKKAKTLGILDDVVPKRQLKRAAIYFIEHKPAKHKPSFIQGLCAYSLPRSLIAKLILASISKKVIKDNYPAPYAVVELFEKEGKYNDRAYLKEAESVVKLIEDNDTAKNLVRVFQLRERIKGFAKKEKYPVQHVHVVGAGVMGGDIAAWCALSGLNVTLEDKTYANISQAIARSYKLFQKKLKDPLLVRAAMDKLTPDPSGLGIAHADVIIEAVFENLEVKQAIIQKMEQQAKEI